MWSVNKFYEANIIDRQRSVYLTSCAVMVDLFIISISTFIPKDLALELFLVW